jgi:hypothetical protein
MNQTHTLTTLKGSITGTLEQIADWQDKMQGAMPDLDGIEESDLVLVETMPEHLRASHEAAGNHGVYPHNGAERIVTYGPAVIEDQWTRIVKPATLRTAARYGFRAEV